MKKIFTNLITISLLLYGVVILNDFIKTLPENEVESLYRNYKII